MKAKNQSGRLVLNLLWREAGYPALSQLETWRTAECAPEDFAQVAREMIAALRAGTVGLHSIRVRWFVRPPAPVEPAETTLVAASQVMESAGGLSAGRAESLDQRTRGTARRHLPLSQRWEFARAQAAHALARANFFEGRLA